MIRIEETEVVGWLAAIRGMRNPMNSWDKSDSRYPHCATEYCKRCSLFDSKKDDCTWPLDSEPFRIGPNDLALMKNLVNAGTDHRKFMRMIVVYCDITAPLYWWKEFDTYKVGTVANSCSTMHKIHAKEFTLEDFSYEHLTEDHNIGGVCMHRFLDALKYTVMELNIARRMFNETKDKRYFDIMIQLLPTSYNQKRTVMLNYEVLANIYKSRKNHKLDEWHDMCRWIESLPYSGLITGKEGDECG